MKSEADENKEMLVIDGNAFYEIDLECVRRKEESEKGTASGCDRPDSRPQRQRG